MPAPIPAITRFGDHVRLEPHPQDARVVTIVLDRPARRNAVDRAVAEALRRRFRAVRCRRTRARVGRAVGRGRHVLRGRRSQGTRRGRAATESRPTATVRWARRACCCSKPVIAAIAGHAVAGGLELALWCDLRVAEEDAMLGVFCRRFGVPLIDGGTVRLPRLIGLSRALDLILTGRAVDADEALAIGLANRVVPHGQRARRGRGARSRAGRAAAGGNACGPALGLRKRSPPRYRRRPAPRRRGRLPGGVRRRPRWRRALQRGRWPAWRRAVTASTAFNSARRGLRFPLKDGKAFPTTTSMEQQHGIGL